MSNYDDTNKGAIWGNKDKTQPNQPDFKGSINVEGVEYWLSGWKRDPNGNPKAPSVKFSVTRKDQVHEQGMAQTNQALSQPAPQQNDFDSDVPF